MDLQIHEAEDAALVFPYLLHCDRIVVIEDYNYHYVYREQPVTNTRTFNVVIAIEKGNIARDVRKTLSKMGVPEEKIILGEVTDD